MELIIRNLSGDSKDDHYLVNQIKDVKSELPLGEDGKLELFFVTGNQNKVKELGELLSDLDWLKLTVLNIDLPEIQAADVLDVVQEKCRSAFKHVTKMPRGGQQAPPIVLIDDTSLKFRALNGMPGPYIKWFMKAVGVEGLPKMLTGFADYGAQAECVFALMARQEEMVFCRGLVNGRIVEARGESWGWDPVFEEQSSGKTYGEMDAATKQQCSHRSKAATILKEYLLTRKNCQS